MNEFYNELKSEGFPVELVGIGRDSHINFLSNWTSGNDASVCADEYPFQVWNDWGASQRDLFVIGFDGSLVLHENITSGIPDNLEELLYSLHIGNEQINPEKFRLYQNYPNPFNPSTNISYEINNIENITIVIYDLKGNYINTIVNMKQEPGLHSFNWYGDNIHGKLVSAGIYIYSLSNGTHRQSKKMILLK